jgi:hypothetical protein
MAPDELLERLARTLRAEIAPAVDGDYQRTQAFMSAVVVEKIARQLRVADVHAGTERREIVAMFEALDATLSDATVPAALRTTLDAARTDGTAGLCRVIEALYAARGDLGEATFDDARSTVRRVLRAQIDRRVEVAR